MVLPCIVCGSILKEIGSGSSNHADDANEFRTFGQYGSTVFDPLNGSYLAVNICDRCLTDAGRQGRVLTALYSTRDLIQWTSEG